MKLALKQIRVYAKLAAIGVVVLVVVLVVWFNRQHRVSVWFFHSFEDVPVLWLILVAGIGSIICFWVVSKIWRTWGELRELQRDKRAQRQLAEQRELMERLAEKERQIDQKLQRSIRQSEQ
ncbi:MAG: hypothetical protein ACE5K7_05045 [Phycisphaerae bacterium]